MISVNKRKQKVGIALFGVGRAGSIHIKNLAASPRVELRWIIEENQERAETLAHELYLYDTNIISSKEVEQVWKDEATHAIVVCVPTDLHEGIIMNGLEAGKAVFSEKPISASIGNTKQCYQKAAEVNKFLFCAFNRRFDPSIRKLRNRVKDGDIGAVRSIKTTARDAPLPPLEYLKISGGLFHDCAVHDIDLILWILGEKPESIFATGHAFNEDIKAMNDVDQAMIVLKFPSGVTATVDMNREAVYGYDQRVEVFGSKGMLQSQNLEDTPIRHHTAIGDTLDPICPSFPQRYSQSYKDEMEHFLDAVEGKRDGVEVSMEETICTSWIAELCEKSMHEGRIIPYTPPEY